MLRHWFLVFCIITTQAFAQTDDTAGAQLTTEERIIELDDKVDRLITATGYVIAITFVSAISGCFCHFMTNRATRLQDPNEWLKAAKAFATEVLPKAMPHIRAGMVATAATGTDSSDIEAGGMGAAKSE